MAGSSEQQVWRPGSESSRRLGISHGAMMAFAVRNNIRRLLREGMPPLYHRDDIEAIASRCRVEGEGVANVAGRTAESPRAGEPEPVGA